VYDRGRHVQLPSSRATDIEQSNHHSAEQRPLSSAHRIPASSSPISPRRIHHTSHELPVTHSSSSSRGRPTSAVVAARSPRYYAGSAAAHSSTSSTLPSRHSFSSSSSHVTHEPFMASSIRNSSSSSNIRSSRHHHHRPFPGRSSYDLVGMLRLRELQREMADARHFAAREEEERREHRSAMEKVPAEVLKPFRVTRAWIASWSEPRSRDAAPPSTSTGTSGSGSRSRLTCPICLSSFLLNHSIIQLPCTHAFCTDCLTPWLMERSSRCPMCRYDVRSNTIDGNR